MRRLVVLVVAMMFLVVGCAGALTGVQKDGVWDVGDKQFHFFTYRSGDKRGINQATPVVVELTTRTGEAKLAYAGSGYQSGIKYAIGTQIIPALAEIAKGAATGVAAAPLFPASKVGVNVQQGQGQVQGQVQGQGQIQGQGQ